jgi:hypothetical protein
MSNGASFPCPTISDEDSDTDSQSDQKCHFCDERVEPDRELYPVFIGENKNPNSLDASASVSNELEDRHQRRFDPRYRALNKAIKNSDQMKLTLDRYIDQTSHQKYIGMDMPPGEIEHTEVTIEVSKQIDTTPDMMVCEFCKDDFQSDE